MKNRVRIAKTAFEKLKLHELYWKSGSSQLDNDL